MTTQAAVPSQAPVITKAPGQFVELDGLKTHFIKVGTGHPLLILHGGSPGACARVIYGPVIEPLAAQGFTVYAFDAPGFGLTATSDDLSPEYRIGHAKAFAAAMGLDHYHVIGNSAGVLPSLRLAVEDHRVRRVVIMAGAAVDVPLSKEAQEASRIHGEELRSYKPGLENMRHLTHGTLWRKDRITEELIQLRYEMSVRRNHEAQEGRRQEPQPRRPRLLTVEELKDLKPRVQIMWGKNDHGNLLERGYRMFEALPNAELHVFDNCGHWPMWDQTERFVRVAADFLNSGE